MTAFDRRQVIDLARDELAGWPIGSGYYGTKVAVDEAREMAEAALPVIVAVAFKPIRELHAPIDAADYSGGPFRGVTQVCIACGTDDGNWQRHPCPTVRLCDEIEAAAKGGE